MRIIGALRLAAGAAIAMALIIGLVDATERCPTVADRSSSGSSCNMPIQSTETTNSRYVGVWITPDGNIRHELLPNGRYAEARGNRQIAYQGRYEISGNHINYWDDSGFTADGVFVDIDTLHHGGMVFHRRK